MNFIARHGGADDQLFGGNRVTPRLEAEISLRTDAGRNDYKFALSYAHSSSHNGGRFFFSEESFRFRTNIVTYPWQSFEGGHSEAEIVVAAQSMEYPGFDTQTARVIVGLLGNCAVYQFHDTSYASNLKKNWDVNDNNHLLSHGGNLAAVLYRLEQEDIRRYEFICRQIARILPGFDRFDIRESHGKVELRWKAKWSDKTFGAHLTSDGSLRFFALVTLLNLPSEMLPDVILLDEPELGLHPAAVDLVGGMINSLATERQVILATQSPLLVDTFDLDETIVLNLQEGRTEFKKLNPEDYQIWLEDGFSPGDLWRQNFLGGRP